MIELWHETIKIDFSPNLFWTMVAPNGKISSSLPSRGIGDPTEGILFSFYPIEEIVNIWESHVSHKVNSLIIDRRENRLRKNYGLKRSRW